jgi:G3E family GTPase
MLRNIPTHLVGGPLGAGKTSLIKHLLANKPAEERWAVLINEFGQVGLDAALLTTTADGIALGEVAGGCLCCVNGVPFQVGLGRLLRKARPDRLFIEPSGLGHPAQLMAQLQQAPWLGVLAVQPSVMVLDAAALANGEVLPAAQQDAIAHAGLLVMNKSEGLDDQIRLEITRRLPGHPLVWTSHGQLLLSQLPGFALQTVVDKSAVDKLLVPESASVLPSVWASADQPLCFSQSATEGWSVGWRWHPSQRFDLQRLKAWLGNEDWLRAKMVIHGEAGWFSANLVARGDIEWRSSEWRQDSRLELIFKASQNVGALQERFITCRI